MVNTVFSIPSTAFEASPSRDAGRRPLRNFIGGKENAALLVATDSIASRPHYNPLLFYGPTGVGKTHLLHALTDLYVELHEAQPVLFLTASDYCRTLSHAREVDAISELREKHRDAPLFTLDDLQEISARPHAQQELLCTLDERVTRQKMTLIASRSSPMELQTLLPGLQSRLSAGLALPIVEPGIDARRAIVAELLEFHGVDITSEARELLIQPGPRAMRKLETVTQLNHALLELSLSETQPVTAALTRDLLDRQPPGVELSLRKITRQTARHFELRMADLVGPSRRRSTVRARGVAIVIARRLLRSSFEALGEHFGRRDHTTVLHAYNKTEDLLQSDPTLQEAVADITRRLGVH